MKNRSTEEQLKLLASIRPDPVFLKWSRKAILAEIHTAEKTEHKTGLWELLRTHKRSVYATQMVGVLMAAFMLIGTPASSPAVSLNGEAIAMERKAIANENNEAEVRYFKGISPAVSLALTDIIEPRTDYGSTNHIKKGIALLDKKN